MNKPADIPQDVWAKATAVTAVLPTAYGWRKITEELARAIMTAKAEEREACAEVVRKMIPTMPPDGPMNKEHQVEYEALGFANPVVLCGTMFGLKVIRHRHFETSFDMGLIPQCGRHGPTNSHRGYSTGAEFVTVAGNNYRRVEGAVAMGIDWYMPRAELSQAIPPAYSEFIGRAAIAHIESLRAAA